MLEYRDGQAGAELLRLQQVKKNLLSTLIDYCESHDIEWFLTAGSALGAVRHGDIIPWDDDIDVGILREDFERLCEELTRDPIPGTFLQHWTSEPGFVLACAILRLNDTYIEDNIAFEGLHRGISLDLFPYDRLPRGSAAIWLQRAILALLKLLITPWPYKPRPGWRFALKKGLRSAVRAVGSVVPITVLLRARDFFSRMDFLPKGELISSHFMYGIMKYRRTVVRLEDTLPTIEGRFGDLAVRLPANPDAFLRRLYGDYMRLPPEDQRRPMHIRKVVFGPE